MIKAFDAKLDFACRHRRGERACRRFGAGGRSVPYRRRVPWAIAAAVQALQRRSRRMCALGLRASSVRDRLLRTPALLSDRRELFARYPSSALVTILDLRRRHPREPSPGPDCACETKSNGGESHAEEFAGNCFAVCCHRRIEHACGCRRAGAGGRRTALHQGFRVPRVPALHLHTMPQRAKHLRALGLRAPSMRGADLRPHRLPVSNNT